MQQEGQNEEGVFCATCAAESTDETPGRISTINGIGRTFHGKAEPCATCGSVVRTLWWTLVRVNIVLSILFSWRRSMVAFARTKLFDKVSYMPRVDRSIRERPSVLSLMECES